MKRILFWFCLGLLLGFPLFLVQGDDDSTGSFEMGYPPLPPTEPGGDDRMKNLIAETITILPTFIVLFAVASIAMGLFRMLTKK